MTSSLTRIAGATLATTVLVLALTAGLIVSSDDSSATGNSIDTAFVADMIPHHRDAVDMARVARDRAEHSEIRTMAREIVSTQGGEITVLERIGEDLHHMGVPGGHVGMSGEVPMSRDGGSFDRAFLEAMIEHHRGAIRMAHRQLTAGEHAGLSHMSRGMIAAQSREMRQMESWHERWYGDR